MNRRRIARWVCAVAAVAMVGLWLFSINRLWEVEYEPYGIGIGNDWSWPGSLAISYATPPTRSLDSKRYDFEDSVRLLPWAYFRRWGGPSRHVRRYIVWIPFWIPLSVSLLGSFILRPKRRPPHGCRKCDYDLTGNVSGVCPECGEPIQSVEKTV